MTSHLINFLNIGSSQDGHTITTKGASNYTDTPPLNNSKRGARDLLGQKIVRLDYTCNAQKMVEMMVEIVEPLPLVRVHRERNHKFQQLQPERENPRKLRNDVS
ncbi:unnamed protein product, partial [Dovyalis caffra]